MFAGFAAIVCALVSAGSVFVDGDIIPADYDSFYHAHRIIDALPSPTHLLQFDPQIHAPEGSWVTWPWAYDMGMAALGHLAGSLGMRHPLGLLVLVAPFWTLVNAALLCGIAAELRLSWPMRVLALLCFALSPLTQELHRVGMLDHHFVEYTFVLATLWLGLRWFAAPSERVRAVALGAALGAAPAFHNGLFILQVPVLVALASQWLANRPPPRPAVLTFAAVLPATTLLFLLPSEPFRNFEFAFTLQSWFHFCIAACTGLTAAAMALVRRSRRSLLWMTLGVVVLAIPIAQQIPRGQHWVAAHLFDLGDMDETYGVTNYLRDGRLWALTRTYSGLIWLQPLCVAGLCLLWRHEPDPRLHFFVIASVLGTFLLLFQYRLHYFGSFALYLPLGVLIDRACIRWPKRSNALIAAAAVMAVAAAAPTYAQVRQPMPIGGSEDYALTRRIYAPLAEACRRAPGIVLADNNDGHYISYHTECSVIANNFILTEQHEQKLELLSHLLSASLSEVLQQAPYIRYIYVRRNDNFYASSCSTNPCRENRGLRQQLLFTDDQDPRLKLVTELNLRDNAGHAQPLARIFEVVKR